MVLVRDESLEEPCLPVVSDGPCNCMLDGKIGTTWVVNVKADGTLDGSWVPVLSMYLLKEYCLSVGGFIDR